MKLFYSVNAKYEKLFSIQGEKSVCLYLLDGQTFFYETILRIFSRLCPTGRFPFCTAPENAKKRNDRSHCASCKIFYLFDGDLFYFQLVALLQIGVLAAAVGTDLALRNGGVGFSAAFAVGNGGDGLPQELTVLQHGVTLTVPLPYIDQVGGNHRRYFSDLQRNPAHSLPLVLLANIHHTVRNVEYNA